MLATVGPLPVIKTQRHLQNSHSASETPIYCHHPSASWRKAIGKEWDSSLVHEVSHSPIALSQWGTLHYDLGYPPRASMT